MELLAARLFQPGDVFRILEPFHDFLISLDRQNHGDGLAVFVTISGSGAAAFISSPYQLSACSKISALNVGKCGQGLVE